MASDENVDESSALRVITDLKDLRATTRSIRSARQTIGLVPTMGALHAGHLSLVRRSVDECDVTVVTIFVNPTQFGPREDFSRYPRTMENDLQELAREHVDLVFAPSTDQIYPDRFSTYVDPPDVAKPLEGCFRPDHFRGVATIVLKLFNMIPADVAYFGQKDFQQVRVIQRMVADLDLPIQIAVCPIVREEDGLAMSSRNRYLSAAERTKSLAIYECLRQASELARQGECDPGIVLKQMRSTLTCRGITDIDYVALVDPGTLEDVDRVNRDTVALVAAHVGKTRLIDNCRIG